MLKDVHCLCTSEVSDNENTGKPQHAQKLKLYNSWKIKGVEISILTLILKKSLYNL